MRSYDVCLRACAGWLMMLAFSFILSDGCKHPGTAPIKALANASIAALLVTLMYMHVKTAHRYFTYLAEPFEPVQHVIERVHQDQTNGWMQNWMNGSMNGRTDK